MSYTNYVILWKGPNGRKRTYNGMTNNITRRFRQHNCELVGGARATSSMIKKYPGTSWHPIIIMNGFTDKCEAMKAEWRIRWPDKKRNKKTIFKLDTGRVQGINHILQTSEKWTASSQIISEQNLTLKIHSDYYDLLNLELCKIKNIAVEKYE